MQNRCQRTHKIDLTISRRARSALSQSLNTQFQRSGKQNQKQSVFHKKMIHLTISRITLEHQQSIQNKNHINILKEADLTVSQLVFTPKDNDKVVPETKTMLNSVQEIQNEDQDKWWEYLHYNESGSKHELIQQLVKTQKKIQYFNALLKQNTLQSKLERSETVTNYESYIGKLKQIYSQQQKQNQKLEQIVKNIEQKQTEELYHLLRTKINRDGQRGLNFSPKRLSVFAGIQEALLLSNKSNQSQQRGMRKESFKFRCALKMKANNSIHNNCIMLYPEKQLETSNNANKRINGHRIP